MEGQQGGGLSPVTAQEAAKPQSTVEVNAVPQTREQRIESLLAEGASKKEGTQAMIGKDFEPMAAGKFFAGFNFDGFQGWEGISPLAQEMLDMQKLASRRDFLELTGDHDVVLSPGQQRFLTEAVDRAVWNPGEREKVQRVQIERDPGKMLAIATYVNSLRK